MPGACNDRLPNYAKNLVCKIAGAALWKILSLAVDLSSLITMMTTIVFSKFQSSFRLMILPLVSWDRFSCIKALDILPVVFSQLVSESGHSIPGGSLNMMPGTHASTWVIAPIGGFHNPKNPPFSQTFYGLKLGSINCRQGNILKQSQENDH